MDPHYTKIALLLDASGSMHACREAVIAGFNAFLWEQQVAAAGRASLTVALFDQGLRAVVPDIPLEDVPVLTPAQYAPHGGSSLLGGLGGLVQGVGYKLSTLREPERPAHVIVAVFTDGLVNNSGSYSLERVNYLVRHQREKYGWEFCFFGAQGESFITAPSLGIQSAHAFDYSMDAVGVQDAFAKLSALVLNLRQKAAVETA